MAVRDMSKLASLLVIGLLVGGCHSKRARYAASGASVAAGVAAIIAAGPAHECSPPPPPDMDTFGIGGLGSTLCEMNQDIRTAWIISGMTMIVAGLATAALTAQGPERDERPEPLPALHRIADVESIRAPRTDDPVLRQLSSQAALAARAGHCTAVRILAVRIAQRDLAYRTTGFVEDSAIAACLR